MTRTLWAASNGQLFGFTPPQLGMSGTVTPNIVLSAVDPDRSYFGLTLDLSENLWTTVANGDPPGPIAKFDRADCIATGSPVPSRELFTSTSGVGFGQLAFDPQNSLWAVAADGVSRSVFQKFSASQYACSGTSQPCIEIGFTPRRALEDFLFDHLGNLWFADAGHGTNDGSVGVISASQLRASNPSISPAVSWSGTHFQAPMGLAFGPTGLLWVADYGDGTTTSRVKAFDPRGAVSGNQAPIIVIDSADFSSGAGNLAFDSDGNLWVMIKDAGIVERFDSADLASSGTKTPSVRLEVASGAAMSVIVFADNPNRSGLVASGAP